jgi:hypothetical protein
MQHAMLLKEIQKRVPEAQVDAHNCAPFARSVIEWTCKLDDRVVQWRQEPLFPTLSVNPHCYLKGTPAGGTYPKTIKHVIEWLQHKERM